MLENANTGMDMFAEQEGEVNDEYFSKIKAAETNYFLADLPAYFRITTFHAWRNGALEDPSHRKILIDFLVTLDHLCVFD